MDDRASCADLFGWVACRGSTFALHYTWFIIAVPITLTRVGAVMRPLARLHVLSPDTPASEALVVSREDVNQRRSPRNLPLQ